VGEILTRVATVSDLHLGATAFGHRKTIVERPEPDVAHPVRCATAAFGDAGRWGAETIVAKGDLTNNGHVDQWRSYAQLVDGAQVPVLAMPGNHDRAWKTGSAGLGPEDAARTFGFEMASPLLVVDRPGVRMVLVDSTSGRHNRGSLAGTADAVVQAVAETERGASALVLLHHQLHQHPVHEGWPVGVHRGATVDFLDRLASTRTPVLVSSGHTHRHRRWEHRGVVVTQVGSTKDYPGVWGGYVVHEGGIRQVVRRVARPDCVAWTEHTRRAALGAWRYISPGPRSSRCFTLAWADR
jgi:3',5'-cyclic AMP phosphodiesterase CpdA